MKWTSNPPTEEGTYWYKQHKFASPVAVRVFRDNWAFHDFDLHCYFLTSDIEEHDLEEAICLKGYWSDEPIEEPEE